MKVYRLSKSNALKMSIEPSRVQVEQHTWKRHGSLRDRDIVSIADLDFYGITINCLQIPLDKILKNGFSTGHGFLRSPNSIISASALACIALQSNQNDMFGGQSIPCFEYYLAPYVAKSFAKHLISVLEVNSECDLSTEASEHIKNLCDELYTKNGTVLSKESKHEIGKYIQTLVKDVDYCIEKAIKLTDKETYQAMEALIHNMNTLQCLPEDEEIKMLDLSSSRNIDKMDIDEKLALKELIINLYSTMTIDEIACELQTTKKIMRNIFKKLEITPRNKKETAIFMKKKNLERIGVENPMQLESVKKKSEQTQRKNHNGLFAFNTQKQRDTMKKLYGKEYSLQVPSILKKQQENNIKKWGHPCTLQNKEVKKKTEQTNLKLYNAKNILCKESTIYPNNNFKTHPENIKKAHETIIKNHGGLGSGAKDIRKKVEASNLKSIGNKMPNLGMQPGYSKKEQVIYDYISSTFPNLTILRRKKSLFTNNRLEVDIYLPQLALGFEIDGSYSHDKTAYLNDIKNKTILTKERFKEVNAQENGFKLINIWEDDIKNNFNMVKNIINNAILEAA